MNTNTDHYTVLWESSSASQAEIKRAYFKLSTILHPDVPKTGNQDEFRKVAEAYKVLSNPEKRKSYDDARSKAIVNDLGADVKSVVDAYFQQFKPTPTH
jgi:DnaJ-class molecular chaperone